jgi:hypothetical protein
VKLVKDRSHPPPVSSDAAMTRNDETGVDTPGVDGKVVQRPGVK